MRSKALLICLMVIAVLGCGVDSGANGKIAMKGQADSEGNKIAAKDLLYEDLITLHELSISDQGAEERISPEDLFGKFYDERATFYVITDPGLFIGDAPVSRLTLFFVDDELMKKKYELEKDIHQDLIRIYRNFSFVPLNANSRQLADTETPVVKEQKTINPLFDHYRLIWRMEFSHILYESERGLFTFIEQHPDYSALSN